MAGLMKRTKSFISYWYVRYLLATELYMVEPWERVVVHIVLAMLFAAFWYLNSKMVGNAVADIITPKPYVETVL